jgi:hypothetical protein
MGDDMSYRRFSVIQPDAAGQTPLGEKAHLRGDELVDLLVGVGDIVLAAGIKMIIGAGRWDDASRVLEDAGFHEIDEIPGNYQWLLTSLGTRCISAAVSGCTGL